MNWWGYVTRIAGTDIQKDIATRTGIDQSTVSRWKSTGKPGVPANVAALARSYKRPVLEAFVEAGFLTADEAKQRPAAVPSLSSLSEIELLEEVLERLRERGEIGGDTAATNRPVTELRAAAARTTGKVSKGQQRRRNADLAGEPAADDPDDFEPR